MKATLQPPPQPLPQTLACQKTFADRKVDCLNHLVDPRDLEFELSLTDLVLLPPEKANGDAAALKKTVSEEDPIRVFSSKEERRCRINCESEGSAGIDGYLPASWTGSLMPLGSKRAVLGRRGKPIVAEDKLSYRRETPMGCLTVVRGWFVIRDWCMKRDKRNRGGISSYAQQ